MPPESTSTCLLTPSPWHRRTPHSRPPRGWFGTMNRAQAGAASPPRRQRAPPLFAPGVQRAGQDPRPARDRRPERVRNAGQPSPGVSHLGCRLGQVRPPAGLQTGLARRHASGRRPLVPLQQAVFGLRGRPHRSEAGRSGVHLWLRIFRRPRLQCGDEPRPLGATASPRSPDPQATGPATNARRRDGTDQHPACAGETSPDDAGTDVHTAPAA